MPMCVCVCRLGVTFDVGSTWCKSRVNLGSPRGQFGLEFGSIWARSPQALKTVWVVGTKRRPTLVEYRPNLAEIGPSPPELGRFGPLVARTQPNIGPHRSKATKLGPGSTNVCTGSTIFCLCSAGVGPNARMWAELAGGGDDGQFGRVGRLRSQLGARCADHPRAPRRYGWPPNHSPSSCGVFRSPKSASPSLSRLRATASAPNLGRCWPKPGFS